MDKNIPEVKNEGEDTPAVASEPATTEPEINPEKPEINPEEVLNEEGKKLREEKEKALSELTNLRKATEEELKKLQEIREAQKLEKEQKDLENLDPYSTEGIDKRMDIKARQAAKEALKESNINKVGKKIMAKYGISYDDFKAKILPRYTVVAGYESEEAVAEDMEAAIRAAMPEVIAKTEEHKIKTEMIKNQNQQIQADGSSSSETLYKQAVTKKNKLSDIERESLTIENQVRQRKNQPSLSEEEFIKEYRLR